MSARPAAALTRPAQLRGHATRARSAAPNAEERKTTAEEMPSFATQRLLLAIMDSNSYLSDGSKQAVAAAALLAKRDEGRVTVLVIDEPGTKADNPEQQIDNIGWHLRDRGCDQYSVLQRQTTQPASVLIGDVADEVSADIVVIASAAVHAKYVDANQLAEFVSCPLLLLP